MMPAEKIVLDSISADLSVVAGDAIAATQAGVCLDDEGHGVGLSLQDASLHALPRQISELAWLQSLYLQGNSLTTLPETLGGLHELRFLNLNGNPITELPDSFWELANLRVLFLGETQLARLDERIANLQSLTFELQTV